MKAKVFYASTFLSSVHNEKISHKERQPPSSCFSHCVKENVGVIKSRNRKVLVFKTHRFYTQQTAKQKSFDCSKRCTMGQKQIKAGQYTLRKIKGKNFSYANWFCSLGVNRAMSALQQQRPSSKTLVTY